ncbi:MAG: hypothetical protein ACC645_15700 [Pirellulales bacterium]
MGPVRFGRAAAILGLALCVPPGLVAQESADRDDRHRADPRIDEVLIDSDNVFGDAEAADNWIYGMANSLRFRTRSRVIARELLFAAGEPADSALLAETERNLRALELFRRVTVDTVRVEGRLIARILTQDAWSTLPIVSGRIASDGTLTGRLGITDKNFLGTGNRLTGAYRRQVDRDGAELGVRWRRLLASQVDVSGNALLLSDGSSGSWLMSDPWRSIEDRMQVSVGGSIADRRRLRYRTFSPTRQDTAQFRQHLFRQGMQIGRAIVATSRRALRVGVLATYRNERFLVAADSMLPVPDSVFVDVGVFAQFQQPKFRVVSYVDGLNQQDVDLSTSIVLAARIAPSAFGYERTGIGPAVRIRGGVAAGPVMLRAEVIANGLFNSAGLDSGRVVAAVTGALQSRNHNATLLRVQGGILERPAPGSEFDLGFSTGLRGFQPHSFVGTRALWGTLEHRWYALPRILDQFGLGIAAYFDFGGAWYGNQDPRWGNELGIGLRTSSRLGASAESGRIDLGYLIGPGLTGSRLVLSAGTSVRFF